VIKDPPSPQDAPAATSAGTLPAEIATTDLLEAVGDGVVLLRRGAESLLVEWSTRRFRELVGRDELPPGTPATFLECPVNRRTLGEVPCTDALPPKAWLVVRRPDGRRLAVDANCQPLPGDRYLVTCTCRDESDPLVAFTEGARIAFFTIDVAAKRLDANDAFYALLGRDPERERARPIEERWALIHPDDLETCRAEFLKLVEEPGGRTDCELRLAMADGSWLWVLQRSRAVAVDLNGRTARISGIVVDVDRRKRAERGLAQSEARYRTIAALTPGLVYEADYGDNGRFTLRWANEGLQTLLGWTLDEVNARGAWDGLLHPDDRTGGAARRAQIFGGDQTRAEVRVLTRAGTYVWVSAFSCPLRDPETGRIASMLGAMFDVTHLKETETALRASEERFRLAAEAFNGIIYDADVRTGHVTRSRGLMEVLGYAPEQLAPTREAWQALMHPDDVARTIPSPWRDDGATDTFDVRYRVRHADGRWVEVWDRSLAVRDSTGAIVRVVGCGIDVTQERRFERMLNQAEAVAHVGSWEVDVATRRILWSPETFRIHELDPDAPQPTIDEAIAYYAPEHRATIQAAVDAGFANGEPWELELQIVTARGRRRWVRASGRVERIDGRAVRLFGAFLDIDTLKRTQLQLQEQGDWLRMSIDASNMAAWRWYPETDECVIQYRSGAAGTGFGSRTIHEWLAIVDAADRERVAAALARTAADGTPTHEEFLVQRSGGRMHWLVARATRSELQGSVVVTGMTHDVTERRVLERELLEISNREQRRIGSDLHDGLGQELTGVALMLRGLASRVGRGQPATPADLDELVGLVNGAIESTRALARGLSPVDPESGGLVFALRALAARARELYGLDVRFRSRVWPEITLDSAAKTHLYRIAQEALTNAARHAQAAHVAISLSARGESVTLSISDDGCGMSKGATDGMGLRIMRYRARMIGGEVTISAADPQGTRVCCRVRQPAADTGDAMARVSA
jgi:PAS domain S-box-containing protein